LTFDLNTLRQQEFDRPAGRFPPAQARRQDPGVVQHQQRPGPELGQNVTESQVLARDAAAIHDQQAGVLTGVCGSGGDPVGGQEELEVGGLQASCSLQSTLQNFVSR
jgi:hypothetical protein